MVVCADCKAVLAENPHNRIVTLDMFYHAVNYLYKRFRGLIGFVKFCVKVVNAVG